MPCKAYFIGGPEDLTKRMLKNELEVVKIPVMPSTLTFANITDDFIPYETISYRRMYKSRLGNVIYEYQG